VSEALVAKVAAPEAPVTELPRGTELAAQTDTTLVAEAVVMPAVAAPEAVTVAVQASAKVEVARVISEALSGGGDNPIDALLDALPGDARSAAAEAIAGGRDAGHIAAFVSAHASFSVELLAIHVDAPPQA
jgi:hypothetical protein